VLVQALVDSPKMVRSQMNFKRLSLTDINIDISRVRKKKVLIEAMESAGMKIFTRQSYFADTCGILNFGCE
jgi:hypothetical protein